MGIIFFFKKEFLLLRNSEFFHQVSLLATGSLAAQIIVISSSRIITRIFSPDALGVVAFFTSIVGLLAIISIMSYPTAIVLPRSDKQALRLIVLSILLATIFSIIFLLIYIVYGERVLGLFEVSKIKSYVYLIPIAIIGSAFSSVTSQWMIRRKLFFLISKIAVIIALATSLIKVIFGYFYPEPLVLVYIYIIGLFFSTMLFLHYSPLESSSFLTKKITTKYGWSQISLEYGIKKYIDKIKNNNL